MITGGRTTQYRDITEGGKTTRVPVFFVLDGQHRLMTMNALMEPQTWVGLHDDARQRYIDNAEDIRFQISVKASGEMTLPQIPSPPVIATFLV